MRAQRRRLLGAAGAAAAWLAMPALAATRTPLPRMTDGPFYPSVSYRAPAASTGTPTSPPCVARDPDGQPRPRATGELLDLFGVVVDADGKRDRPRRGRDLAVRRLGSYLHPRGAGGRVDADFQGFGTHRHATPRANTASAPSSRCRTPAARRTSTSRCATPTIGEVTSQLFVAGEPGNARDFLYQQPLRGRAGERRAAPATCAGRIGRQLAGRERARRRPLISRRRGLAARSSSRRRRRPARPGWRG